MADMSSKPPHEFLQELLDAPARIIQRDLVELENLQARLELARADYDAVAAQVAEMLALGWPVEQGALSVRVEGGRIVLVDHASEESGTVF
jgi:hypothetical protein